MRTNEIRILGVRIDNLEKKEVNAALEQIFCAGSRQNFIVTLNPEIILEARRSEEYRSILNSSDMNICDGIGIKMLGLLKGKRIKERYAGADLMDFILREANKRNYKVLIISKGDAISSPEEIISAIRSKYQLEAEVKKVSEHDLFSSDISKNAEVIISNFGAPLQEKFLFKNKVNFPSARLLLGVGGAFDFLTGKIRRAPRIFQALGLEWLWRLAQEPKRLGRIWRAVVLFPVVVWRHDN